MKEFINCRRSADTFFFLARRLVFEGGNPEGQSKGPEKKEGEPKPSPTLEQTKKDYEAKKGTLQAKIADYEKDTSEAVKAKAQEAKAQMDQIDKDAQAPALTEDQHRAFITRIDTILAKYEPEVKEIRDSEKAHSDLQGAVKEAMGTDLSQIKDESAQFDAVLKALQFSVSRERSGAINIPNTVKPFTVYGQDQQGHMWEVKWNGSATEIYKVDKKGLDDATNKASGVETTDKDAVGRARGKLADAITWGEGVAGDDGNPDNQFSKLQKAISDFMNDPGVDKKPSDGKGYSVAAADKWGRVWSVRIDGNGAVTAIYRGDGVVLDAVQKNLQAARDATEKPDEAAKAKEALDKATKDLQGTVEAAKPVGQLKPGDEYDAMMSALRKAVAGKQYPGVKEFSVTTDFNGHKWEVKWTGQGVEIGADGSLGKDLDAILSKADREAAGKELAAKLKDSPAYADIVLSRVFAAYSKLEAPRPKIADYMSSFGKDAVMAFQSKMLDKGSSLGKYGDKQDGVDGIVGPVTQKAIEAYYKDQLATLNAAPGAPAMTLEAATSKVDGQKADVVGKMQALKVGENVNVKLADSQYTIYREAGGGGKETFRAVGPGPSNIYYNDNADQLFTQLREDALRPYKKSETPAPKPGV